MLLSFSPTIALKGTKQHKIVTKKMNIETDQVERVKSIFGQMDTVDNVDLEVFTLSIIGFNEYSDLLLSFTGGS